MYHCVSKFTTNALIRFTDMIMICLLFTGYPRYIINNNVYSPYLSYLPATESLSLFAHNSGPTAQPQNSSHVTYHRIYDLHKGEVIQDLPCTIADRDSHVLYNR